MKKSALVMGCVLVSLCWAQAQSADPGMPAGGTSQAEADPQSTPPAQPSPASQPADPQTAPPAAPSPSQAPTQTGQPTVSAPPELPKYPDVRMPGEYGVWIGLGLAEPTGQPIFDKGHNSQVTNNSLITFQGTPKLGESAEIGFAMGLHNALVVSGFETRAAGDFTAATALTLWGQTYDQGVLVSTNYQVQDLKFSFEYLTWPYPVESRRFRLKTLWQIQYVNVSSGFDAPLLPITTSSGAALIGPNGQPVDYQAAGSRWILSPTLGLGTSYYLSKFLRLQFDGSGFALPKRWTLWDSDGSVNIRFGHFELSGGVRAFHVKTSTQGTYYIRGTLISPQVSLRWYSR